MMNWLSLDFVSMILVGLLWGCTNPFLRKGSVEVNKSAAAAAADNNNNNTDDDEHKKKKKKTKNPMTVWQVFRNMQLYVPFLLNQAGSLVFYFLLANSNISMAVPICNAFALVFSFLTSAFVTGEPIEKPIHIIVGASLILVGVTICVSSQEE